MHNDINNMLITCIGLWPVACLVTSLQTVAWIHIVESLIKRVII